MFSQGTGVGGVALKDPRGQGLAVGGRQQTDHDLFFAPLAFAVVAKGGQLVVIAPGVDGAGDIGLIQTLLDLRLRIPLPVQ